MRKNLTWALAVSLLAGLGAARAEADQGSVQWVAPDFFIRTIPGGPGMEALQAPQTECRSGIPAKICLTESQDDTTCEPGGEAYAGKIQDLYDQDPPLLQSVFCDIRVIYVHKHLDSIAYAGLDRFASGESAGAVMGIRQSVLDTGIPLSKLMTWKEQIPFGGDTTSYDHPRADLPRIVASIPGTSNDTLFYVLAHEFGHILDFRNSFNRTALCVPFTTWCHESGWNAISWDGDSSRYDAQYPLRSRVHFYDAGPELGPSDVPALYDQLLKTDFVTMYASTNRYEDFAESFAFYNMRQKGGTYLLVYPLNGAERTVDMTARLDTPLLQKKMDFIRGFIAGGVKPDAVTQAPAATRLPPVALPAELLHPEAVDFDGR